MDVEVGEGVATPVGVRLGGMAEGDIEGRGVNVGIDVGVGGVFEFVEIEVGESVGCEIGLKVRQANRITEIYNPAR